MKKIIVFLTISAMVLTFIFTMNSCKKISNDPTVTTEKKSTTDDVVIKEGIAISDPEITIGVGEKKLLTVTLISSGFETSNILWVSSDPSIAYVNAQGQVTGISDGETNVTATTIDGKYSVVCSVRVTSSVTDIIISQTSLELDIGQISRLYAEVYPAGIAAELVWSSTVEAVADVSEDGIVTAKQIGSTSIIVSTKDKKFTASCKVTVLNPATGIEISDESIKLSKGVSQKITANVLPEDATRKNVTWSSSNESVATVSSDGIITAVGSGSAIITASSYNGYKATCLVDVSASVTSITINKPEVVIEIGENDQLSVIFEPIDASIQKLVWSSSDSEIVSVDNNGYLYAKSTGIATVTAKTVDGGFTSTCIVKVVDPSIIITFAETEISMFTGDTLKLNPIITPPTTSESFTWTSSDKSVASVNKNGVVTAKAVGVAEITVTSTSGSTCSLFVTVEEAILDIEIESIEFETDYVEVTVGNYVNVNINILPLNATETDFSFVFSKKSAEYIKVKDGKLFALKEGSVIVTLEAENGVKSTGRLVIKINPMDQDQFNIIKEEYLSKLETENNLHNSNVESIHAKYDSDISQYQELVDNSEYSEEEFISSLEDLEATLIIYQNDHETDRTEEIQQLQAQINELNGLYNEFKANLDLLNSFKSLLNSDLSKENERHNGVCNELNEEYDYIVANL